MQTSVPPMTEKPPVLLLPPPPSGPPANAIRELVSQNAGKIQTPQQLTATVTQAFPNATPTDLQQAQKVWNDTRQGQGIDPAGRPPVLPPPGAVPPPAVNSTTVPGGNRTGESDQFGTLPQRQVTAPPVASQTVPEAYTPQVKPVSYTAPQYEPPKKGLQYAAMALSLLFPGAPIGRAAASFAQGLNTGAEHKYERAKQTADQQLKVDQFNSETDLKNQTAKYMSMRDKINSENQDNESQRQFLQTQLNAQFDNGVIVRANRMDQAAKGVDWRSGKAFVYPTLDKLVGPKPTTESYMKAYGQLEQMARQNGDTGAVTQYGTALKEYLDIAKSQQTQAAELQRTIATITGANSREVASINAANARAAAQIGAANWRTQYIQASEDARSLQNNSIKRVELQSQVVAKSQAFTNDWQKLTKPDAQGHVQLVPEMANVLQGAMRQLQNPNFTGLDPTGAAVYLADKTPGLDASSKLLLQQYGEIVQFKRMAAGGMVMPNTFAPPKLPTIQLEVSQAKEAIAGGADAGATLQAFMQRNKIPEAKAKALLGIQPPKELAPSVHGPMPSGTAPLVRMPGR